MLTSVPAWREPTVPRKTVGTLTSSNSESVHTSIFPTVLYKSFAVATPEHSGPLPLGRIVAFAPDLRRASFHGVSRSPSPQHHYGALITSDAHHTGKSSSALWLRSHANSFKVATPIGTSNRSDHRNSLHIHHCVIYLQWLLGLWLCAVLASGPTSALQLCDPTLALAMPPVNQLNSLKHLQNLPLHKAMARAGRPPPC
jgi:hypothetical protein